MYENKNGISLIPTGLPVGVVRWDSTMFSLDYEHFKRLDSLLYNKSRFELLIVATDDDECYMRKFFNDSDKEGTDEQFGHFFNALIDVNI